MRYCLLLALLLPVSSWAETWLVNANHLNLRAAPSADADVLWEIEGGSKVTTSQPEQERSTDGFIWRKVAFDKYDGTTVGGWVATDYLIHTSRFTPYSPDEPRTVTFPLVDFETAFLLLTDGSFKMVEPASIDGLDFGCGENSLVIDNFCVYEGGELWVAGNMIWAKGAEHYDKESPSYQPFFSGNEAFRLESNGTVCSFSQASLEPGMPAFRTCSSDRYNNHYTDLASEL